MTQDVLHKNVSNASLMAYNAMTMNLSQSRSRFIVLLRRAEITPRFAFSDRKGARSRPYMSMGGIVARHVVCTRESSLKTPGVQDKGISRMRFTTAVFA